MVFWWLSEADIGKAMLSSGPLTSFMDSVSFVETVRKKLCLKQRGLDLRDSKCETTCEELRVLNWNLLSGAKGYDIVSEYSQLLNLHEESELTRPFGLEFKDSTMCETYRRICLPARQLKFLILEIGLMLVDDAMKFLEDLAGQPRCCSGHPLVQAAY